MSKNLHTEIKLLIRGLENRKINTDLAIDKYASIKSDYEEKFFIDIKRIKELDASENFLEQRKRLIIYNNVLNKIMVKKALGIYISEEEASFLINKTNAFVF